MATVSPEERMNNMPATTCDGNDEQNRRRNENQSCD
jgi:hypothetical protein